MPGEQWNDLAAAVAKLPATMQHGVAVQRLSDGATWQHQGYRPFPAASTIKLAILVAVARAMDAGTVAHDQLIPVRRESRVAGSGVLTSLRPDLPLSTNDLAYLMIAISDNTASNALIEHVGDDYIADTIQALGLSGTQLKRRFIGRLPGPDEPDNWTTASDLVTLLSGIASDTAASPDQCRWMRDLLAQQQHRDRLARHLPGSITFAGKSGSLPGIVHDCGLLTGAGGTVAVAVLLEGVSDPYAADALLGQIAQAAANMVN